MPIPESWKKNNTYGKIIGHQINLNKAKGMSKEDAVKDAKMIVEQVLEKKRRKKI